MGDDDFKLSLIATFRKHLERARQSKDGTCSEVYIGGSWYVCIGLATLDNVVRDVAAEVAKERKTR